MSALTVEDVLQGYASRGLLRDFRPRDEGDFSFLWMNHKPMRLQWKPQQKTVLFRDILPNIPARGEMDREIRDFVKAMASADRPAHRRVNPADFDLVCQNRKSSVSIGLTLTGGGEADAMDKLMLVTHELFLMLHDRWLDYMHEEFGASLE